ncbi:MAG: response regulator [Bacteroidaceae bacterium]|nr:response regulator [Bacteroidaceae bacterium]
MPRLFLFILACACSILLPAQTDRVAFRRYMAANGLSDNDVLCGLRDSYGFMWLGTANGLNCFDGQRNSAFHQFTQATASVEGNQVTSLLEVDGAIWAGTAQGVYVHDRTTGTLTRFTASTRYGVLVSSTVQRMAQAPDGRVWICTLGQGVFLYTPRTGELVQDSRAAAFITDLVAGRDGRVYLSSLDGRLLVFAASGHCLAEYPVPGFVNDKNSICLGSVGDRIFVGCDQGLYSFLPGTDALKPVSLPAQIGFVRSLLPDGSDRLLLGTDHGLYRYHLTSGTVARVDEPGDAINGLSDDCINGLLRDRDGTLWVFTLNGGVCYQPSLPRYLQVHSLPGKDQRSTVVRTFCPVPDGTLYVGTDAGLFHFRPSTGELTPVPLGTETYDVTTLMLDSTFLWVGTRHDGIIIRDLTNGTLRRHVYSSTKPYTVASNEINRIFRTRRGDIFVATSWGIRRFDREEQRFMGFSEINAMTPFVDIAEDSLGNIWAATTGRGLFRMAPDRFVFEVFNMQSGLHSNAVSTVTADRSGDLWVAFKDGVLQRRRPTGTSFEDFPLNSPVAPRQILFIVEDDDARLWVGTEAGILCIPPDRSAATDAPRLSSLLQRDRQTVAAACVTPAGGFIGSAGQFITFDPNRAAATEPAPPVYILSLSLPFVDDSHQELQRLQLDRPLYTASSIRLPFADNSFTLHFAAPHFLGSTPVRYEYMLRGYEQTWARGTETAEVTYSHLPPGDYEFLLREVSSTNPGTYARLAVTVLPPWYRTIWAWLAYALIVIALLVLLALRASRIMRRRYDRRLEDYRLQQEKQNFQSKISFFINLVHEIRTPLTLMSLPLEQMEQQDLGPENRQHINAISRNMNYLLGITNQLLDFQKAENGRVNLHLSVCDVPQLLTELAAQFTDAMEVRGMHFQLQLPPALTATLDRDKISKVIMNLLGNALKYAHSEVILRLEEAPDDRLVIAVVDDGPGIPDSEKNRIFDLYHQIAGDDIAATLGTGLGLANAKMLARSHGGEITATDSPGGGTTFLLTLPRNQETTNQVTEGSPLPTSSKGEESTSPLGEDGKGLPEGATTRYTLLLVEDNEELLTATAAGLRPAYRVLKARDGLQALDLLKHQEVDIIISDVMMPRMDGNQLCQAVKADINTSHIPVILLTAKTSVAAKVEGMASGADVYLEKPFSMRQLQLQLQNILRLRQQFHERLRQIDGTSTEAIPGDFGINEQDLRFMERLKELVEKNMKDEQFSIDTLAEQMNMSRSSFYRKIKALTDLTPVDYMKNQRLQRAAVLLRQGQRITEVAAQVGFTSSSYFAKCFRARFGVLPKDFVNETEEHS